MRGRMKVLLTVLGLSAVLLAAGSIALATHTNPNELHACYKNNNGQMRFVGDPATCLSSETAISWNQQGLPGPVGADGAQGPAGPQGNPGVDGNDGAQGPAGPQGDPGVNGNDGAPGLSGLVTVSVTENRTNSGAQAAIANCPAGKQVIGGGGYVSPINGPLALQVSRPFGNGWEANAHTTVVQNFSWSVTAYAICATVAP